MRPTIAAALAAAAIAAHASCAVASPISITNADFSNPSLAPNGIVTTVAGWATTGDTGITRLQQPQATTPVGLPQTAYLNYGQISQTLGATLQQNMAYTLSFYYVARSDDPSASAVVELLAGSSVLATLAVGAGTANSVALGTSAQKTLAYSATDPGMSGTLQLLVQNTSNAQVDVTGFSLDAASINPVPEPASLVLLGAGLFSIGIARRKPA